MKTNLKRVSKRSLALILGILMLFSTLTVGIITVNAWNNAVSLHGPFSSVDTYWHEYNISSGTCSIDFTDSQVGQELQFEIGIQSVNKKYTATTATTFENSVSDVAFQSEDNGYNTTKIKITQAGTYVFTYNSTTHKFGVTYPGGSTGGGTSNYKLMKNDHTYEGEQVATFTGSGDTYTATYDITTTGDYYFYVNDGKSDYLNANKTFDGNDVRLYPYGTSDYTHSIKLTATIVGTYTFTFKVDSTKGEYYINYTAPTETPTEPATEAPTEAPTTAPATEAQKQVNLLTAYNSNDSTDDCVYNESMTSVPMTYDSESQTYYADINYTGTERYLHYRFEYDGKQYSSDWYNGYPKGHSVKLDVDWDVTANKDVSGWDNKATITYDTTEGTSFRVWFRLSDSKTKITSPAGAYTITKGSTTNGSFNVSRTSADEGDSITVTPTSNTGFTVDEVYYINGTTSEKVTITADSEGQYVFEMPASSITVYATFKEVLSPATVYAKTGTAMNQVIDASSNPGTYSWGSQTVLTASSGVSLTNGSYDSYNTKQYSVEPGTTVTITTTLSSSAPSGSYVPWYCVNGKMVSATKNEDGTFSAEYTVTSSADLEITPVYYNTNYDEDYVTIYVKDVDNIIADNWGNTISIYSYYYGSSGTETAHRPDGYYCGQPMVYDEATGYYIAKVAKQIDGDNVSGVTLNGYANDTVHQLFLTDAQKKNQQTYDFDNFKICALNGYNTVRFEPRVSEANSDNLPRDTGYSNIETAFANGWETLVDYFGDTCSLVGQTENLDLDNNLWVVSNYENISGYGQWGTKYYVYDNSGKFITSGVPSDFIPRRDSEGNISDSQTDAYNAIVNGGYDKKAVKVTFERETYFGGDGTNRDTADTTRLDGIWYYTYAQAQKKATVDAKILYGDNASSTSMSSWTVDTYKADTSTGTSTGSTITLSDGTNSGVSLEVAVGTTVTGTQTSGLSYEFAGWARLNDDGALVLLGTSDLSIEVANNITYYALYVPAKATMTITYNFYDYQGPIAYAAEGSAEDTKADTQASYSVIVPITVTQAQSAESRKQLVIDNAPMIQSDYYDYVLNNSSITTTYSDGVVTGTADYNNTPHLYTVNLPDGTKKRGYYQHPVHLDASDYGYDDSSVLWKLTTEWGETLNYQTEVVGVYRYMSDNATLSITDNDDITLLDNTTTLVNSYYELRPDDATSTTKLTQNFYIIHHVDDPDNFVGGGIIFYSGDQDGTPLNGTVNDVIATDSSIINFAGGFIGSNYTEDVSKVDSATKVGIKYVPFSDSRYTWSDYIYAQQNIIGVVVTNKVANANNTICAKSFMIYKDSDGNYQYVVSDNLAIARAYVEETHS
ncbi:MAG: hypothetical protein ACI4HO_10755 [Ruminococcus sp.]